MDRRSAHALRLALLAAFGAVLVLVVALPLHVIDSGLLPEALERAIPLRAYLSRVDRESKALDFGPHVLTRFASDPKLAADEIDLSIRRFAVGKANAGWFARCLANLERADREVAPAGTVAASSLESVDLPLRRIEALGERGVAIQRVSAENASRMPKQLRRAVATLIAAAERVAPLARALRQEALGSSSISGIDLAAIEKAMLREDPDPGVVAALPEIARRNDLSAWLLGLIELADAADGVRDVLIACGHDHVEDPLRPLPDGVGVPRNLVFASECDAGLVLIGGGGATVMPLNGVAVAIDLSGSDRWQGDASFGGSSLEPASVRIAIDVSGDDRWCGERFGTGFALGGIVLDEDLDGNDRYESGSFGVGGAVLGAALVLDEAGDDHYAIASHGLGFGALGVGALIDVAGDDLYRADRCALGAGAAAGIGCAVDGGGTDVYVTDLNMASRRCEKTLGAAFALAGLGAGVGLFVERGGADNYRLGSRAGASAADHGLALFVDAGGSDLYSGSEYCFGSGVSDGTAIFRDFAGDDDYLARGFSLGCGVAGLGVFIDDRGIDDALALDPSKGVVRDGGSSLFADMGRDSAAGAASDRAPEKR